MIGIYARVSTEEQAKKGYSLEEQVYQCKKKAKTEECIEYVDDGYSGEYLDRPALTKLRHDLKEGLITEVICYDPDRLSRKLMNQLIVSDEIEKKAKLIFVNGEYQKTPEGLLFYQLRGAISEFEKAKINERMSGGRRRKAKKGLIVKNPNVYGYGFDKETCQLVIKEDEAAVVKMIFELFTKPNNWVQGLNGIAKFLTDKKIPTKKGVGVWHRQVVRQIIMNETYVGRFYHNRWNTEGMLGNKHKSKDERTSMKERPREEWIEIAVPSIIPESTFEHAQRLLSESRRRWAKRGLREYLLSGLVRCGECGNTMTGRRAKNWGTYVFQYTDVKNYSGAKHPGCGLNVIADELDHEVWSKIKVWLDNPDEIAASNEEIDHQEHSTFEETEIIRLRKEVEKTRSGRKRLIGLFAEDVDLSEDEIKQSLKTLKDKENRLLLQIKDIENTLARAVENEYSMNILKTAAEFYLNKGEEELTFEDKKELIRSVVREIRVYKDRTEIYTF